MVRLGVEYCVMSHLFRLLIRGVTLIRFAGHQQVPCSVGNERWFPVPVDQERVLQEGLIAQHIQPFADAPYTT